MKLTLNAIIKAKIAMSWRCSKRKCNRAKLSTLLQFIFHKSGGRNFCETVVHSYQDNSLANKIKPSKVI